MMSKNAQTVTVAVNGADSSAHTFANGEMVETREREVIIIITDGIIVEAAGFQDGSAFAWHFRQTPDEIKSDVDSHEAKGIEELEAAYGVYEDPDTIKTPAGRIIHEIAGVEEEEEEGDEMPDYVGINQALYTDAESECISMCRVNKDFRCFNVMGVSLRWAV